MTGRLDGLRAVVTGSASGIGKAVALRFLAEGASVAFLDKSPIDLDATVKDVGREHAHVVQVDLGEESGVSLAVSESVRLLGGLDVVVANAGIQLFGLDAPVIDLSLEVWQRTMNANLTSAFLTAKHTLPHLLESGGGSLIFTGSPTGLFGVAPDFTAYSSSKSGVHGLARVIAAQYGRRGVRSNVVIPGYTRTPLVSSISEDPAAVAKQTDLIPLGRPGETADLEGIMVYLASAESAYSTGGFFMVDGGMTAI